MGRFFAVITACLSLVLLSVVPIAAAEPDVQPVGNVPRPDGPAPAWIARTGTPARCWPSVT